MPSHIRPDALPQQQKGLEAALILDSYERSSELQRRSHAFQKVAPVPEQGSRVEAAGSIGGGQPVSADDLLLLFIPDEKMEILTIKLIEVHGMTRALAGRAKRDLAQPPDLLQGRRDLVHLGKISRKLRVSGEAPRGSQRPNFLGHSVAGDGIDDRRARLIAV